MVEERILMNRKIEQDDQRDVGRTARRRGISQYSCEVANHPHTDWTPNHTVV